MNAGLETAATCKQTRRKPASRVPVFLSLHAVVLSCAFHFGCRLCHGQSVSPHPPAVATQQAVPNGDDRTSPNVELLMGSTLTRQGKLPDAIPHLLAAQAAGADPYATAVNLGICYIGTGRYKDAVSLLENARSAGHDTATSEILLAQAYLGDRRNQRAWDAFLAATLLTPDDEKLYAFMADACTDQRNFDMGLRVMDVGLQHLPGSARLHYERGLFLAQLDRLEEGRPEFDRAAQLAPDSYIATLALVQWDLYDGYIAAARHRLLAAVGAGHRDYQTLSLLGTVLLHAGAAPGDPEFAQAQAVLEESARTNPEYSATQIALGRIYILEDRYSDAIEHLEIGRRLEPRNPAVYSNLVRAYHHLGDTQKAHEMQQQLARLLAEQTAPAASRE